MNCAETNHIDMVDYLNSLGFHATNIKGDDYWYHSPFREEKKPSFKVNRHKNVWYDHGFGRGGKLIDFITEFYRCATSEALQKLFFFHPQHLQDNNYQRPLFHLHQNSLINHKDARETGIRIIAPKQPINDLALCRYVRQRRIEKSIAERYAYEVHFTAGEKEKIYRVVGFKNNAGGFELRNEYFKGSSSPKYITYLDNKAKNISVFEGFFDFLSYQTIHQNQEKDSSNFLVLNSLSFFERSLLLMEKHQGIHLYLDHDNAGRKCTEMALQRSKNVKDESTLYQGYQDINDWPMNFGKLLPKQELKKSQGRHPGGRPIKSSKGDVLKGIRFTKTEYKTLEQKAAAAGVPVTAYIRQICLYGKVIQKMDEEERAFVRQLIGMANNLNQLTKKAHQEGLIAAMFLFAKEKNIIDNLLEKMDKR